MAKETRTRNWTIVVYPDSAPENWRDILDDSHIEWVESPFHEFDSDPEGTLKKPHWHVLLMFGGIKSYDQVIEFIKPLNCPVPQRCHNAKSIVRYMAHLDHPHKYQYSISDIIAHGGVDIADLLKPSSSEENTLLREMLDYISAFNVTEISELIDYAAVEKPDTWFPLLAYKCSYFINLYIKSNRQRIHEMRCLNE